ncbi:MAG TPA: MBOAT family O-acyltransferase [Phenylobacterium sp.]|jgi:D-alanyl-lipoteichoic acid acyltransferase DltB (MBOAT superfamily)
MLFNSFIFIFAFLPLAFVAFYGLRLVGGRRAAMWLLTLASIAFYAWWLPSQTWILLVSIVGNYFAGHFIQKYRETNRGLAKLILFLGLGADLGALLYFKYAMFILANVKLVSGADFVIPHIILPLGISFFTFQKIAYLVDCSRGEAKNTTFSEFALFAAFFPQLIAGPIVHHKEIIPQFRNEVFGRLQWSNVLVGLSIFSMGLFKKTVIADSLAGYFGPTYKAALAHGPVDPMTGWVMAVAWTLQVYFDFSGYSDLAIGLARMFGVRLPLNFHSPLRAASITEYWRRWHMSLQRFVVSYIFQPLALPLNRLSAKYNAQGWTAFALTVAIPSFITFFVLGVWHGAGWNYVVFGLLHGGYVSINEAYREAKRRRRRALRRAGKPAPTEGIPRRAFYHILTLVSALTANMFFRAGSLHEGFAVARGMWGFNGLLPSAGLVEPAFVGLLVLAAFIVVFMPNTQQIMRNYRPAVNWRQWRTVGQSPISWTWRPTLPHLLYIAVALFLGVEFIQRGAEIFVYFNF